ncbi:AarF/UbiB family protein [Vicingaceae bacterium]|nr:AarF/UbiB family protein [Vicingaceae bacterium]
MKTIDKIPTSKISRATKMLKFGTQVGANYIKYFGDKIISDEESAKARLDEANAEDIYNGLSELKGSALKVAQMMSMDEELLPKAFVEKFSLAQFSVPPLSAPLSKKVISRELGGDPKKKFDRINYTSTYAASIGQVHEAWIADKKFALKVQYPGVAESISSDLNLIKPFALRMFNLKSAEVEGYFLEVKNKLYEETDYELELDQLNEISAACSHIDGIVFPKTFSDYSSKSLLTMEWMEGLHLSEYTDSEASTKDRNKIAQTLWDFFMYQIHVLQKVHADPHPGNFLVSNKNELIALDFGCVKVLPKEFYDPYFELTKIENITNSEKLLKILDELEMVLDEDSADDKKLLTDTFEEVLSILNKPFQFEKFDFSQPEYFNDLLKLGGTLKDDKRLRKLNGSRGSKHFLYVNRTLFGLLGLMNSLKAGPINVMNYKNI